MRAPVAAVLAAAAALGCAGVSPKPSFDAAAHLRRELAATLGAAQAARLDVPFALDAEARAKLDEVLPVGGSRRSRISRLLGRLAELDLEYTLVPTRDASAVLRTREANCLSFVHLFVALGRRLGLDVLYVEARDRQRWDEEAGAVVSRGHVVGGLWVDGELRTFDFLPYRPAAYRDLRPIDDRRAFAHHLNNLGAEALLGGNVEAAESPLRQATAIDPAFVEAQNNLGVWHARRGELERAAELFREGLVLAPDDVALLGNLARLCQRTGRVAEAEELLHKIAGLRHANPFFHVYLGDAALERGEPETALEAMREALRRDPMLPEVQLGMARAFAALGEVERARHHLDRARRLDPHDPEVQRWAALLGLDPQ